MPVAALSGTSTKRQRSNQSVQASVRSYFTPAAGANPAQRRNGLQRLPTAAPVPTAPAPQPRPARHPPAQLSPHRSSSMPGVGTESAPTAACCHVSARPASASATPAGAAAAAAAFPACQAPVHQCADAALGPWLLSCKLVGRRHQDARHAAARRLQQGGRLAVAREPDNPMDANALLVSGAGASRGSMPTTENPAVLGAAPVRGPRRRCFVVGGARGRRVCGRLSRTGSWRAAGPSVVSLSAAAAAVCARQGRALRCGAPASHRFP